MPVKDNAIYHLAGALKKSFQFAFPLKTNAVTAAYFEQMAKLDDGPRKEDLGKIAGGSQEAMQRVADASPAWNSTLRTTCVATMLEGGHALNALPQLAAATVNCRVLPEDSPEYVLATLKKSCQRRSGNRHADGRYDQRPGVTDAPRRVERGSRHHEHHVARRGDSADHGDGRDRRKISAHRGIPTYGVQGFFMDRDDIRFHGRR